MKIRSTPVSSSNDGPRPRSSPEASRRSDRLLHRMWRFPTQLVEGNSSIPALVLGSGPASRSKAMSVLRNPQRRISRACGRWSTMPMLVPSVAPSDLVDYPLTKPSFKLRETQKPDCSAERIGPHWSRKWPTQEQRLSSACSHNVPMKVVHRLQDSQPKRPLLEKPRQRN